MHVILITMTQAFAPAPESLPQPNHVPVNQTQEDQAWSRIAELNGNPDLYAKVSYAEIIALASTALGQTTEVQGPYSTADINLEVGDANAYTMDDVTKSLSRTARERATVPTDTEVVSSAAYVRPDVAEAVQPRRKPPVEADPATADRSHLQPGRDYRNNQQLAELRKRSTAS